MTREEAKNMALSRDCHCIKGKNRDSNYDECIDKVFDYFESELKKLRVGDVSGQSEQLVCTFCGINPIDEVCKHPKVCSEKKKVKAN